MRKKNDILLKSAFEESFSDLLYFFFKDADIVFDFERGFDFMDKELAELFPDLEKKGWKSICRYAGKNLFENGCRRIYSRAY